MEPKIELTRVITGLRPSKYWRQFAEEYQIEKLLMLRPGDEVIFKIPKGNCRLSFVGERPEKYVIESDLVRIYMPVGECVIFFDYQVEGEFEPEKIEVAVNF